MTGPSQSREVLTMDQKEPCVTFTKKKGCFISRAVCIALIVLFISAIIATALLVYHYAPVIRGDGSGDASGQMGDKSDMKTTSAMPPKPSTRSYLPITTPRGPGTTESSKKKKKLNVRLPKSLIPEHYTVRLQPFINGNFSINGYVEVDMMVKEATRNISIHIADIITYNDTTKVMSLDKSENIRILRHEYDVPRQFYIVHLADSLMPGRRYRMSLNFMGLLNDKLQGFYRSVYKDEDGNDVLLATTQFQPTDARRAFPCFDEPGLKATFTISLARQTNMSSLSNMPKYNTTPIEGQDNWVWDDFEKTVPMSTYLVAFVVSDFAHRNATTKTDTLFRVWARNSAIEQAEYAKDKGPLILHFFEDYFDIPFPLPKSDMIALPDFSAGAMENWGLITYRETAMLYDPLVSAAGNKQRVAVVVAHELAHQWFGNLVTPEWWTDLWLNEGFASYMEYLGTDAAEPSWNMLQQFVIEDLQDVFGIDCLESSHPISIPVGHPNEIAEIFDRISYGKGASIIRMMSHFLTETTFRNGLTKYLDFLKYKSAEQDDLWKFLTEEGHLQGTLPSNLTVKDVMDTWTLQMGYPVITVTRDNAGRATIDQERFLLVKNKNSADTHDYKWWIPLTYTTQMSPDFKNTKQSMWMTNTEAQKTITGLPSKDKWVVFNIQQTGYYRVNYDQENWDALIRQLNNDHTVIDPINRAQIIDDSLDLARAGIISYNSGLGAISYLGKENEYAPWMAALNNLGYIKDILTGTDSHEMIKKYFLSILVPLYDSVGFEDNLQDAQLNQLKRMNAISWACSLKHPDCIDNSVKLFSEWMRNPSNFSIISPNIKSTVYCTAIKHGGDEEWNFAWDRFVASNVATEKAKLLSALGCTNNTQILSDYIEKGFTDNSGVRKQDATRVFSSVARNVVGRKLAWDYLRTNWDTITKYFGESNIGSRSAILKYGTRSFKTREQLMELEKFHATNLESFGSGKRAVEQALERTKNNIAWMDRSYHVITNWLKTRTS